MKYFLALLTLLSLSTAALASEPEYIEILPWPRLEIDFALGSAQQTGYLTTDKSVGAYVLGVNLETETGLMTFEWNGFKANHNTPEFNLATGREVRVSSFSFIPQFKVLDKGAWNIFLGLGITQVGLYQADPDYYTLYGSYILSGLLRYRLNDRWSIHYKSQWYGVRQAANNVETGFEVWNNLIGVGYRIR
jgi:hypothetical protein